MKKGSILLVVSLLLLMGIGAGIGMVLQENNSDPLGDRVGHLINVLGKPFGRKPQEPLSFYSDSQGRVMMKDGSSVVSPEAFAASIQKEGRKEKKADLKPEKEPSDEQAEAEDVNQAAGRKVLSVWSSAMAKAKQRNIVTVERAKDMLMLPPGVCDIGRDLQKGTPFGSGEFTEANLMACIGGADSLSGLDVGGKSIVVGKIGESARYE